MLRNWFLNKSLLRLIGLSLILLLAPPLWANAAWETQNNPGSAKQNSTPTIRVVTGALDAFNAGYKIEKLEGPRTDFVKAFLDKKDLNYTIEPMYWGRAYNLAMTGNNVLIYPLTRSPERESDFHWIEAVSHQEYRLIGLSSISPNDLTKAQIIGGGYYAICDGRSISCSSLLKFGFPENRIIRNNSTQFVDNIRLLVNGRATFMMEDWDEVIAPVLEKNPQFKDKIQPIKDYAILQPNYLAGKNLSPEALKALTAGN